MTDSVDRMPGAPARRGVEWMTVDGNEAADVIKATMAGANVTQMVSALLRHGPDHLRTIVREVVTWMNEHEWNSLSEMRGNMSLLKVPDPEAYERANYMRMPQGKQVSDR